MTIRDISSHSTLSNVRAVVEPDILAKTRAYDIGQNSDAFYDLLIVAQLAPGSDPSFFTSQSVNRKLIELPTFLYGFQLDLKPINDH